MMKVCVVFLATLAVATAVRIQNCGGSAKVDFSRIQITGCDAVSRRCIFVKGKDATMSLPFTPGEDAKEDDVHEPFQVTSVKAKVTGIVSFIPVPFDLPNDNGCVDSGLTCPLQPNNPVIYSASLPVKSSYPSIPVTVQWELLDQNNNRMVCIKFPVQLQ